MPERKLGRTVVVHPYAWLWEPLETDASFVLRPMFGTKIAYLDGKLMLCFAAKTEPWRGILVCTDRPSQASLRADYPELVPHPVLPKWLYLPESENRFEEVAQRLVKLAKTRDKRIGVVGKTKKKTVNRRYAERRRAEQ